MAASTARACLRRLSECVHSVTRAQAPARSIKPADGPATYRWTSSRRATAPRARGRGCDVPRPFAGAFSHPWRDRSRLPSPSWCPWESRARGLLELLLQRLDLFLERVNALHHLLESSGQWVRQIRLVEIDAAHPCPVTECYPARDADDNRVFRHLPHYHRARADAASRADGEGADDLRARSHHHVVGESGVTLLPLVAGAAEGHSLEQAHVPADLRRLTDDHAHAVVDEEPGAQLGRGMDLDAREETAEVRQPACGGRPSRPPQGVRDAMDPDGVDAGIAQHDLEGGARSRIALQHGSDILAHRFEHGAPSLPFASPGRRAPLTAARAPPPRPRAAARREARPRRLRSSPLQSA